MTFGEGQGHSNWYHISEFSGVSDHTKFERNQFVNVQTQANNKAFFVNLQNEGSHPRILIRPTALNSI